MDDYPLIEIILEYKLSSDDGLTLEGELSPE
jgi:hypothetical protein